MSEQAEQTITTGDFIAEILKVEGVRELEMHNEAEFIVVEAHFDQGSMIVINWEEEGEERLVNSLRNLLIDLRRWMELKRSVDRHVRN